MLPFELRKVTTEEEFNMQKRVIKIMNFYLFICEFFNNLYQ
jgi:hypothetical protein